MGRGQHLYKKAKQLIPGGTQLLSKRPEMWLPEIWPSYYDRAKGCEVWDLDGNHYYDFSIMGVGASVLGYAFDEVDEGEAMAMAVRIARAYTGKDIVLVCGYHGWHDWYLSANLVKGDPLAEVHLKGLAPAGVPKGLAGTNMIFHYNQIDEFMSLINGYKGQIAAVVMEPVRNEFPKQGYLETIRKVCDEEGIVLVFDEITAGFRLCAGGSHRKLGVDPDMAVSGKALANGYPLSAVTGRSRVMQAAQDTFISSTFWTERVALAAAVKSVECYQKYKVDKVQQHVGTVVREGWYKAARQYGIKIYTGGILPLIHFSFADKDPLLYKTYFTQEMLKEGFLAAGAVYASYAHTDDKIRAYLEAVSRVFCKIAEAGNDETEIRKRVTCGVCHAGFERLN